MTFQFAPSRHVPSPDGLFFYHSIDVPGLGQLQGDWDLRDDAHAYLGNVDFNQKRCLDVGAGCGYLTFEMERLGAADVVSHDIRAGSDWNIVPHYKLSPSAMTEIRRKADVSIEQQKDAYWFCHRLLGSRAKVYYGDIYNLPEDLGLFDVVFYGMILTHLRDPYWALYNGAKLSRRTLVITGIWSNTDQPVSVFRPSDAKSDNLSIKSWWLLSRGTLVGMAGTLGFKLDRRVFSNVKIRRNGVYEPCVCEALVFERI